MATDWRWYFGDRDYYLRDKTEQLASDLAAAASRERSERHRLAKQQGTLEERLDRLTDDVHRLVELSDLRDELDFFADNEAVRRRVRTALVAMELLGPSGRPMAPPSAFELRDDTVDYWLAPATRSLPGVLAGAEPGADADGVEAPGPGPGAARPGCAEAAAGAGGPGPRGAAGGGPGPGGDDGADDGGRRRMVRAASAGWHRRRHPGPAPGGAGGAGRRGHSGRGAAAAAGRGPPPPAPDRRRGGGRHRAGPTRSRGPGRSAGRPPCRRRPAPRSRPGRGPRAAHRAGLAGRRRAQATPCPAACSAGSRTTTTSRPARTSSCGS